MTTIDMIKVYINHLCTQIGVTPESVYNEEYKSWSFSKGSSNIEVFFTSYETASNTIRTFLRCFSAVYPLPPEPQKQLDLYRVAMECNVNYMGVKLGGLLNRGYLYAVAERDIEGMDYDEFVTMVSDLGYWAERLSGELRAKLGVPQTNLN